MKQNYIPPMPSPEDIYYTDCVMARWLGWSFVSAGSQGGMHNDAIFDGLILNEPLNRLRSLKLIMAWNEGARMAENGLYLKCPLKGTSTIIE